MAAPAVYSATRRSIHFGLQDTSTDNVTFNTNITGSSPSQKVGFSLGEVLDPRFNEAYGLIEIDGSREMALDDAYRGGSNHSFELKFHPHNWLILYLVFGKISAYNSADITATPSTQKPVTGSGDPSQIWVVDNASLITAGTGAFGDDSSGTNWSININSSGIDTTNNYIYIDSATINGADPKVGDTITPLSSNTGGSSTAKIVGFVHTYERHTSLPYFSALGITEEPKEWRFTGCWMQNCSVQYTQGAVTEVSASGQALTLSRPTKSAASVIDANTGEYVYKYGMYMPCTAGRKTGINTQAFRFESNDKANHPNSIKISSGSTPADPPTEEFMPYIMSISQDFSNEFRRAPINNDTDADYFIKSNHTNKLGIVMDIPQDSTKYDIIYNAITNQYPINIDITYALSAGQKCIFHYRHVKIINPTQNANVSLQWNLQPSIINQPVATVIDDAYRIVVTA